MKSRLLFMDVDGTLTDGKVYISSNGELFKAFDIKDGYGIHDLLPKYGIIPIIITKRKSELLNCRCAELGINEIYQGVQNKEDTFNYVINKYKLVHEDGIYNQIAYIGDDIPDYACMKNAKYKGCPANSVKQIREIADFISKYDGGDGAVRDFIEWLISVDF